MTVFSRALWINGGRARVYAGALGGGLYVLTLLGLPRLPHGPPLATDFAAFWAAAQLATAGHPDAAYSHAVIESVERAATSMPPGYLAFYYPPSFLLLLLPLGVLSYGAALIAFLAAETALVLALLRRILPQRWAWVPLLAFPGFLMNALSGQNAALSASCFAAAAIWLDRRPLLAGAALGGLACKPQLAVLVPAALLAARRLQALAACAAAAALLAALSWLAFGAVAWRGFLAAAPGARADIETLAIKWPKMQSLYGAIRLAGFGSTPAYAAQAVLSAASLVLLAWIAAHRPGAALEAAALTTAALLFTPFLYDYDLALLAVPLACLLADAQPAGWLPWERLLLAVLFVCPLFARAAGMLAGIAIGPPLLAVLLLAIARRATLVRR